jgi:hypothetical protein
VEHKYEQDTFIIGLELFDDDVVELRRTDGQTEGRTGGADARIICFAGARQNFRKILKR